MTKTALITGGSGFIGSALIDRMSKDGWQVVNLDIKPPTLEPSNARWVYGDIMEPEGLRSIFLAAQPQLVVHLAARTDTNSGDVRDYAVNVVGTQNVVDASAIGSVQQFIHTSTQYVAKHGTDVSDPLAFDPFTAYGESKVLSEGIIRESLEGIPWTIVRPTNIWGPKHPRYPHEFLRVLDRGLYVHPSGRKVTRTYGYVGNVADQYAQIANPGARKVDSRILYLGDSPIDLADWVDEFSRAITGRSARRVPFAALKSVAMCGDLASKFGVRLPLTSTRLKSMTEDYVVPTNETISLLGAPPMSMTEGVRETVAWLHAEGLVRQR